MSLAACASGAEKRSASFQADTQTCEAFGAQFGSQTYSECMLVQQQRRDAKMLDSLERMALTSQIAKDAQFLAERARRDRCKRNPDRRECK
jgi:hypothetical protein